MTWYNILFLSVLGFLLLKSIISWFFGEMEVDVDFDGDSDIDISGMLSFKGLLHFLLGFSTVLSSTSYSHTNSFTTPYEFSVWIYLMAIVVGMIFMIGLYYLYKMMLKFNHYNTNNPEFNGMRGTIYAKQVQTHYPFIQYQILVNTYQGTHKLTAYSLSDYKVGDEVTIILNKDKNQYEI